MRKSSLKPGGVIDEENYTKYCREEIRKELHEAILKTVMIQLSSGITFRGSIQII